MGIVQIDISMWDPKVCRPFIAGICPHDLFTNTVRYTFSSFGIPLRECKWSERGGERERGVVELTCSSLVCLMHG